MLWQCYIRTAGRSFFDGWRRATVGTTHDGPVLRRRSIRRLNSTFRLLTEARVTERVRLAVDLYMHMQQTGQTDVEGIVDRKWNATRK